MASPELVILTSPDAEEWQQTFGAEIRSRIPSLLSRTIVHRDLLHHRNHVTSAQLLLLVVSEDLFSILQDNPQFSYHQFLTNPSTVFIVLHGVDRLHFKRTKTSQQFPDLKLFKNFASDDCQGIIDSIGAAVRALRSSVQGQRSSVEGQRSSVDGQRLETGEVKPPVVQRKRNLGGNDRVFTLWPKKITLPISREVDTDVLVILSEAIRDNRPLQVLIFDLQHFDDPDAYIIRRRLEKRNDFTFVFKAPELSEGNYVIRVMGLQEPAQQTLKYDSHATEITARDQLFIQWSVLHPVVSYAANGQYCSQWSVLHPMPMVSTAANGQYCIQCIKGVVCVAYANGAKMSELDRAMTDALLGNGAHPVGTPETIFNILSQSSADHLPFELPTLLHLAAQFGFTELANELMKLPSAPVANATSNLLAKYPCDIARSIGHRDLANKLSYERASAACCPGSVLKFSTVTKNRESSGFYDVSMRVQGARQGVRCKAWCKDVALEDFQRQQGVKPKDFQRHQSSGSLAASAPLTSSEVDSLPVQHRHSQTKPKAPPRVESREGRPPVAAKPRSA
ncbi:hypothetical protein CAPTEDRAFT_200736 [Capitella teleta]|uniref:DBB domain-containing protein n=1 Tax=Capitella teleta TaxID=283909 RepID=R7UZ78_CAPTE|nr:hypothetical protein CAPTEDRAFT_200736 [Capitella teleta]|eukprot:ELU09257.1 hypothetical protein CAPTEDRAFT_200736 [Capitella teleta]